MDYPITLESFKDVGPILKELNLATHQNALYLEAGEKMTTLKRYSFSMKWDSKYMRTVITAKTVKSLEAILMYRI